MSQSSESFVPSGLTVDGIAVPQTVEAEGAAAVTMYVAEQQALGAALAESAAPASAPNPLTFDEGAES